MSVYVLRYISKKAINFNNKQKCVFWLIYFRSHWKKFCQISAYNNTESLAFCYGEGRPPPPPPLKIGTLGFIKSYQSVSVKFIEHPQCFTFRIILWFYAILRAFVLYSHYGYSISNEKLNGHQAFESLGLLRSTHFSLQTTHFITVIITNK